MMRTETLKQIIRTQSPSLPIQTAPLAVVRPMWLQEFLETPWQPSRESPLLLQSMYLKQTRSDSEPTMEHYKDVRILSLSAREYCIRLHSQHYLLRPALRMIGIPSSLPSTMITIISSAVTTRLRSLSLLMRAPIVVVELWVRACQLRAQPLPQE